MKKLARITLAVLVIAGLWLALSPSVEQRRITFLPVAWSQYLDLVDFWFNLAAFALLAATAWLAFDLTTTRLEQVLRRACWAIGIITICNAAIEIAQMKIPGRAVDINDIWAGLIGSVLGVACGHTFLSRSSRPLSHDRVPKVLFLDQTGCLGGAELMLLDIAAGRSADSEVILFQDGEFRTALEAKDVRTRVVAMDQGAAAVTKQTSFWIALKAAPQMVWMIMKVAKAARLFDVVYANTAKALIIGGIAARLARRPLVFHLHDIVSGGHFSTINRQALVVTANLCATSIIANSEATKSAFVASGGNARRCVVIPNGFDRSKKNLTDDGSLTLREDLGITAESWVVLMAGRLSHWKGQHVLLDALKQVPGAHAILLGDALFTDADREYAQQLRMTASKPELVGRVHFAGFQLVTTPFFSIADVVVHASIFPEPFGRVIVEGMLAGKPVIATRAGGAAEIIEDGCTGLLVRTGDVDELTDALVRLKSQPEFAARLAEAAEREARETYSLTAVKAQIESVIRLAAHRQMKPDTQCLADSSVDKTWSVPTPIN